MRPVLACPLTTENLIFLRAANPGDAAGSEGPKGVASVPKLHYLCYEGAEASPCGPSEHAIPGWSGGPDTCTSYPGMWR